jgi:uncharacterized membrane protein YebE (DUF533 family)
MSIQNLLNQFLGAGNTASTGGNPTAGMGNTLSKLSNNIPGGLAGGAAAGGLVALLMGSKSARKFAGKAAGYGGAALLGGLAYSAYKSWQQNSSQTAVTQTGQHNPAIANRSDFISEQTLSPAFQLTLVKAMIAAAKADGHIDVAEQQRIFTAVEQMDLTAETKGLLFDLLRQPIAVDELVRGIQGMEQKTELYLASCLVIDPDHPAEQAHLEQLAQALQLEPELAQQLQWQAQQAVTQAA